MHAGRYVDTLQVLGLRVTEIIGGKCLDKFVESVSGAVCASTLARNGLSVTIFDSARGPGGRMSQRR